MRASPAYIPPSMTRSAYPKAMPAFVAVPAKEVCPISYQETREAHTVLMQPLTSRE